MSLVDLSRVNRGVQPPPLGYSPDDPKERSRRLAEWVDAGIYYDDPLRNKDMSDNRRWELFDQCIQWLQKAPGGNDEAGQYSSFVDLAWQGTMLIPTPVFNEGLGARQNETARLARPNFRPAVKPKSDDPNLKEREAARKMQGTLRYRLKQQRADRDMALFYYHLPLYGGAWMKSEVTATYDKTKPVPSQTAVQCVAPGCDFKLSSPEVPPDLAAKLEGVQVPDGGTADVRVSSCPQCADHPPLQAFKPSLQEAASMQDKVGRPMGTPEPLADWDLTIRSDYDVFPRNRGFDMRPGSCDEWCEVHVENLDWIALRFPQRAGEVKPENPSALAKWHPVASMPQVFPGLNSRGKMFENCSRVKERHKRPWMELVCDPKTGEAIKDRKGNVKYQMNRGRSVVMAGDVVLFDGTYLFESTTNRGEWIPRVVMSYTPWEFRDGGRRLRGMGLWDVMFSPQESANTVRSQTQAVRQRLAVPIYLTLKEHNFEIQAMKGGIPGLWATINAEAGDPIIEPKIINNVTIDPGVHYELEDAIQFLQRAGHLVEVERGQPPPNVSAASALELLKGAASEGREARLERIQRDLEELWVHGQQIIKAVYLEPRQVKLDDDSDGREAWTFVQATDFSNDTEVTTEAEPDFDEKTKSVEVFRDMVQNRMVDPTTIKPRRLSKLLGGPSEPWEQEDKQVDKAQREFLRFKQGKVPYVDPGLDDHGEHNEQHGQDAMDEWFRDLAERANWDEALKFLGGTWGATMDFLLWTANQDARCLQERIEEAWWQSLNVAASTPDPSDPTGTTMLFYTDDDEALAQVIHWRAHMEAHELEEMRAQQRAQMQAGVLPAPGSGDATAAGTMPTPGQPAVAPGAPGMVLPAASMVQ